MANKIFTKEEIKRRRLFRLAQLIYDHWEEGSGMDTRYFDHPFIQNEYVEFGCSPSGGTYREHAVPRAYLREQCMLLLQQGSSLEDIVRILEENLRIVRISSEEADLLNSQFKTSMPDDWIIGEHDPLARFHRVGITVLDIQA